MGRVIPITEQFQHFLEDVRESFWGDLYGKTKLLWKGFWEEQSRRERDRYLRHWLSSNTALSNRRSPEAGGGIRRTSSGPSLRWYGSMQRPHARTRCSTAVWSVRSMGWSSICSANARRCRARSCGKLTDLNVCCSVATTRTSTATSLLASNSAWRHFSLIVRCLSPAGSRPPSTLVPRLPDNSAERRRHLELRRT